MADYLITESIIVCELWNSFLNIESFDICIEAFGKAA